MLSDPPAYGENRVGWYQIDRWWYLTFDTAKRELEVTTKQLKELIRNHVSTETLQNPYNFKVFTVYSLDSLLGVKK